MWPPHRRSGRERLLERRLAARRRGAHVSQSIDTRTGLRPGWPTPSLNGRLVGLVAVECDGPYEDDVNAVLVIALTKEPVAGVQARCRAPVHRE